MEEWEWWLTVHLTWSPLWCHAHPGLGLVFLSVKRNDHFHETCTLQRKKKKKKEKKRHVCNIAAGLRLPPALSILLFVQVKGNVPHSTDKRLSAHSLLELQTMSTRLAFVLTLYRLAFPLWWALWLRRGLLRRRGLLLLLSGVDHDRCRLDRWGVLRLSWIVCSRCGNEGESGWKQWSHVRVSLLQCLCLLSWSVIKSPVPQV